MGYEFYIKQSKSMLEIIFCRKLHENPSLTNALDSSSIHPKMGKDCHTPFSIYRQRGFNP